MAQPTLGAALSAGRERLQGNSPSPGIDARRLLEAASGANPSDLVAFPERTLEFEQRQRYEAWIEARRTGVPVAYLTGSCGFHAIELAVDQRALVPRPETEWLVDFFTRTLPKNGRLLDLGTGSGAIALAVAAARADIRVVATDASPDALALAKTNRDRLGMGERVTLLACHWGRGLLPPAPLRFDGVVSNPPYVEDTPPHRAGPLRHEPWEALMAGRDGLDAIRALLPDARRLAQPGAWIALEHGATQHADVATLMARHGLEAVYGVVDAAGLDRFTLGRRPEAMA